MDSSARLFGELLKNSSWALRRACLDELFEELLMGSAVRLFSELLEERLMGSSASSLKSSLLTLRRASWEKLLMSSAARLFGRALDGLCNAPLR